MKAGADRARGHDLSALRFVASVGEPLNPEVVVWGSGGIRPARPRQLVADRNRRHHDLQLRRHGDPARVDGAAAARRRGGPRGPGRPGPADCQRRRGRPRRRRRTPSANWPCGPAGPRCSAATCNEEERYRRCFAGGWYLTGDLARRDADGYYWFVGRGDDVIKSSGHLIGPFEVESCLMEHDAVAEAGVIGVPDPVAGEVVKAFVELRPGWRAVRGTAAGYHRLRPESGSARRWRPGCWSSPRPSPRPAAGRSSGGCSRPASWASRRVTPPRSRPRHGRTART